MDPATLSVWGAEGAVLEVGSGVSSMEKAEGGASVVGAGSGAGASVADSSSHEGVSPSMILLLRR